MDLRTAQTLEQINRRLSRMEQQIDRLEEKLDFSVALHRNHLIRLKQQTPLRDSAILLGCPYNDLTPQQAYQIINDPNQNFILLDVSRAEHTAPLKFTSILTIPLETLKTEYVQLESKTIPILVISEQGIRSIEACELLIRRGYYNVNNISGGYAYYPLNDDNYSSNSISPSSTE